MRLTILLLVLAGNLLAGTTWVQASLIVGGTRLIYPENAKEIRVQLNNPEPRAKLAQAWVDNGNPNASPDSADVPFLIMPPLARIEGKGTHNLRLMFTQQQSLPKDRESLFWFNVLDIPPVDKLQTQNYLELTYRTRIKLFYRPSALTGSAEQAAESVIWRITRDDKGYRLKGINNGAYYVSLNSVVVIDAGKRYSQQGELITPAGSTEFLLPGLHALPSEKACVEYQWIDDYGAIHQQRSFLQY
ncbi:MAG: fimbria/pilus periplasmic chaperone [Chania sp.]